MAAFLWALLGAFVIVGAGLFARHHATYYQQPDDEPLLGRIHEPARVADRGQASPDRDGA